jgi:hypothetical protein
MAWRNSLLLDTKVNPHQNVLLVVQRKASENVGIASINNLDLTAGEVQILQMNLRRF